MGQGSHPLTVDRLWENPIIFFCLSLLQPSFLCTFVTLFGKDFDSMMVLKCTKS